MVHYCRLVHNSAGTLHHIYYFQVIDDTHDIRQGGIFGSFFLEVLHSLTSCRARDFFSCANQNKKIYPGPPGSSSAPCPRPSQIQTPSTPTATDAATTTTPAANNTDSSQATNNAAEQEEEKRRRGATNSRNRQQTIGKFTKDRISDVKESTDD